MRNQVEMSQSKIPPQVEVKILEQDIPRTTSNLSYQTWHPSDRAMGYGGTWPEQPDRVIRAESCQAGKINESTAVHHGNDINGNVSGRQRPPKNSTCTFELPRLKVQANIRRSQPPEK